MAENNLAEELGQDLCNTDDSEPYRQPNILQVYFKEMRVYPLLTREEERGLAREIQGSRSNLDALVFGSLFSKEKIAKIKESVKQGIREGYLRELKNYQTAISSSPNEKLLKGYEKLMGIRPEELDAHILKLEYEMQRYKESRNKMLVSNLALVINIAKKYSGLGLEFSDLIQEGNLGLIKTIEKYDYTKGYKFSTYAVWWIRQRILKAIAEQGGLTVSLNRKIRKLRKATNRLIQRFGKNNFSDEDIENESGFSPEEMKILTNIGHASNPFSLDAPLNGDGETELYPFIPSDGPSPYDCATALERGDKINESLNQLGSKGNKTLRLRFGINKNKEHTLGEIGIELGGLTRERARQIEAGALTKLKKGPDSKTLEELI